jgi:hypothetical protein
LVRIVSVGAIIIAENGVALRAEVVESYAAVIPVITNTITICV